MEMRIPPLGINVIIVSNLLKSRILVWRLAVGVGRGRERSRLRQTEGDVRAKSPRQFLCVALDQLLRFQSEPRACPSHVYVCMYVYIYIYIHTYAYVCVYIYIYICLILSLSICIYIYMYIHMYMYIRVYTYMYVCMCVYIYIYIYVYIYIYIYTHLIAYVIILGIDLLRMITAGGPTRGAFRTTRAFSPKLRIYFADFPRIYETPEIIT